MLNFVIDNQLLYEWIVLSADVSFLLGVEQEGSVFYLSKLVLYPFVKHTWKTSIDVSQCSSLFFFLFLGNLCLYYVFITLICSMYLAQWSPNFLIMQKKFNQ